MKVKTNDYYWFFFVSTTAVVNKDVYNDRHHERGATHFLATFIAVVIQVCCKLFVACKLASFNF